MEQKNLIYNSGVVPLKPRDCGRAYDEVSDEELRSLITELTQRELESPFARYYSREMPRPSEEKILAYENGPMAPEDGYMFTQCGERFLVPGDDALECGYCILPNGVGYVAMRINQPGRTNEKQLKFNEEFAPTDNLAYKIWHPKAHLMHFKDGAYEDFGWGPQKIRFQAPIPLERLGLSQEFIEKRDPDTLFLMCNSSSAYNPFDPEKRIEYSSMMRQLRRTPEGRELRIRYWFGATIQPDGTFVTSLTEGERIPEENMRLMCKHCAWEYTNEAYLVEKLWADPEF